MGSQRVACMRIAPSGLSTCSQCPHLPRRWLLLAFVVKTQCAPNSSHATDLLPSALSSLCSELCRGSPPFSARTNATEERAGGDSVRRESEESEAQLLRHKRGGTR